MILFVQLFLAVHGFPSPVTLATKSEQSGHIIVFVFVYDLNIYH